jgi:hypothetical protein
MRMGVDAVFPIHHARNYDFRRGKRLGKKDHLMQWKKPVRPEWMDETTYKNFPDCVTVREVSTSSDRDGFRAKARVIVTTFLNSNEVTKQDLGELYNQRWMVEINLRSIKETMHMDIMRGKTPEIVRKEIWMHLLAYNLVRKIMAQAAHRYKKRPQELSFKLALQMMFAFRQLQIFSDKDEKLYGELLRAIVYKRVGNRPGRMEPRAVKRRPKPFPKLQIARGLYKKNRMCLSLS